MIVVFHAVLAGLENTVWDRFLTSNEEGRTNSGT